MPWIIAEVEKAWPEQDAYTLFKNALDRSGELRPAQTAKWANLKAETWEAGKPVSMNKSRSAWSSCPSRPRQRIAYLTRQLDTHSV